MQRERRSVRLRPRAQRQATEASAACMASHSRRIAVLEGLRRPVAGLRGSQVVEVAPLLPGLAGSVTKRRPMSDFQMRTPTSFIPERTPASSPNTISTSATSFSERAGRWTPHLTCSVGHTPEARVRCETSVHGSARPAASRGSGSLPCVCA
jgi:hypothetical protein